MILIEVLGVPDSTNKEYLTSYWLKMRLAVDEFPELAAHKDKVAVFFHRDQIQEGLGEEIMVKVYGLFEIIERTNKVKNDYANSLSRITRNFFRKALVDVRILSSDEHEVHLISEPKE